VPPLIYVLAPLLVTALPACGGGKHSTATTPVHAEAHASVTAGFACRPVPAPAAQHITWVPADLPLPPGTQPVTDDPVGGDGTHHGVFATPVNIKDFVRFAIAQWPPKGWHLGRGDSEANEAEDEFVRAKEGGSFKVRSDYCDTNWSELNLFYKPGLP
jgi:hypothetical protein